MASAKKHQVLIIGGGPAGTCTALFLHKLGISSIIVEKEKFPRYHIGESFTGETGGQLRKLDMAPLLTKFDYPVKVGTKVVGAGGNNSFYVPVMARINGKLTAMTTWQARRSDFDNLLLETALERGVQMFSGEAVVPLKEDDRVVGVRCRSKEGVEEDIKAEVTIDCSGQNTFLANKGITGPKVRGDFDKQIAIFSQVTGAVRDEGEIRDNTVIFYKKRNHWSWFIPIDKDIVSIGVVTPGEYFTSRKLSKLDFMKEEIQTLNPDLTRRVQNVEFVEEARGVANYSYWIKKFVGKGFLCVGDSHRFIDPIFSFGLLFASKEAEYSAQAIHDFFAGKLNSDDPFAEYERFADRAQDVIQVMMDCFWEWPLPFQKYVHMTDREDMIDIFAGRVYGEEPHNTEAMKKMKRLLEISNAKKAEAMVSA